MIDFLIVSIQFLIARYSMSPDPGMDITYRRISILSFQGNYKSVRYT